MISVLAMLAGIALLLIVLQDAFEVMLLPRRVQRNLRFMRLYFRAIWAVWSGVGARLSAGARRERFLSVFGALSMVLLRSGRLQEIPTPEQAAAYPYSPSELDLIRAMGSTEVVGTADSVAHGLDELADRFGVQEMLISTRAHGAAAKHRSMELIAGAYALQGRVAH